MRPKLKEINNNGFSLISIIIAAGILSAVSLTIAQLSKSSFSMKKRMSNNSEISLVVYQVTQALSSIKNCNLNLKKDEFPELSNKNGLLKYFFDKDGNTEQRLFLDIDNEKSKTGIIVKNMKLLISKSDAKKIGANNIEYASTDLHGYAEIKLEFGRNSTSHKGKYKKVANRLIPIFLNLNSAYKFESCYATAFNELLKGAIAKAVEKSCGLGLKYNQNIDNPQCIPESDIQEIASCPVGQYIKDIKLISNEGKLKYMSTCSPLLCQQGEIGVWYDNKMSCTKCANTELPVMTNTGLKCQNMDCFSSKSIKYLSGIDSVTGEKKCRTLVDPGNKKCGENGFHLIESIADGSVSSKCCKDCPDTSKVCSGLRVAVTNDCKVDCRGKMTRMPMIYSGWGPCSLKTGQKICTQERVGQCRHFDKNGYPCCDSERFIQTIERQCSTGNWYFESCPKNFTKTVIQEPKCSNLCCNPKTRPNIRKCIPKTSAGGTLEQCNNSGGTFVTYGGQTLCKVAGDCPGFYNPLFPQRRLGRFWIKVYARHYGVSAVGTTFGFCLSEDSCNALPKLYWHREAPPSCSYDAFRNTFCVGIRRVKLIGKTIESLCK